MSLDAFGGVLVNSPSELTVQPLLAPHSSFMTPAAFIPGPPTEITLDEDDVFQCGKCKKVFTSFQLFMFHKKEHQLSSSGSKFFGMTLALNGGLGGSLNNVGLVDQEVGLQGSGAPQLAQNQCCQELPLSEHIEECLDSSSQQVSSDVLEYGGLGESAFDELHSDISQPMMLGDSDSLSFSMEQNALNISSTDQIPENGFVSSSMSDIQSTILQDKLIQHEDCETSCDHVWHLPQKDDSSSLNFASSGFGEEQPLFLGGKKFSVTSGEKMSQNIEYSNDDLLPEAPFSSDKEVFINDSSSINVQEVMAESESQGILPPGEFFSKTSMDYISNSDLLTEFEKVGEHSLVNNQIGEPVTVLEVEMPLLSSAQLQTSLMDSSVLHSDIPALMPLGEQNMEEECDSHQVHQENIQNHLSVQKACHSEGTNVTQESIISPEDVCGEEMILQAEPITKQVISLMKGSRVDKSRKELEKSCIKIHSKERKDKIFKKRDLSVRMLKSSKSMEKFSGAPVTQQSRKEKPKFPIVSENKESSSSHEKSKQTSNVLKKVKSIKNQKLVNVSPVLPLSPKTGIRPESPAAAVTFPLEIAQPSTCRNSLSIRTDKAAKKKPKESSWEPRALKLTCEFCYKKFAKQFDLQQHLRSHTGEKPFQCIVCGRAFAQKSNVTKHIRTHKVWPKGVLTLPKNFLQKVEFSKKTGSDQVIEKDEAKGNDGFVGKVINHVVLNDSSIVDPSESDIKQSSTLQKDKKKKKICPLGEETEEYIIDNSYICQFCNASFSSYFELKTHLKVHQDEKVYFCNQKGCKQTFSDLTSFVDHLQMHDSLDTTYRCHVCKETFKSLADLGTHQYTHSSCEKFSPKRSAFKCPECRSRFVSPEALDHHLMTASHKHPCPECKREFTCERNLRRHLTTHSTACPFVCKECGKGFKTEAYLNVHLTMHSKDKPYACSQCPAKFARKDRLSRHFLIHQESKRIKCPFHVHLNCHRVFTRKDKLKAHVFTHTEHKHLNCASCKREFVNFSGNKKYHKMSNSVSDVLFDPSSSEDGREFLKDVSSTDQDESGESPSSVDSEKMENHDEIFEATSAICQDESPISSTCFLTSENLPTIEIIVMPLPLSIS